MGVCSRNLNLEDQSGNRFWDAARRSGAIREVSSWYGNIAIQGEVCVRGVTTSGGTPSRRSAISFLKKMTDKTLTIVIYGVLFK